MARLLPVDCLNGIFENLEEDKFTLHSCLLVNRLWCKVSVRILWMDIWSFYYSVDYNHRLSVISAILSTLIACLPNESKELLLKNGIFIPTPTSNPPLFDYVTFCKVLSINEIVLMVDGVLKSIQPIALLNSKDRNCLVTKEIIKMFMNRISSLKKYHLKTFKNTHQISFKDYITLTCIPERSDCLADLSELNCSSNIYSEFFYQLSKICHNLQSICIEFEDGDISSGLKELISLQNNLKNLKLSAYSENDWTDIIPAITKNFNTLTKLHLYSDNGRLPLSFVSSFSNLQEIDFSFSLFDGVNTDDFDDFKKLQYVTFPRLHALKIPYDCPNPKYLIKFLETNGKNLKELYINENNSNLSIDKFCPNLKKIFLRFHSDELDALKTIFNNCQYLESIGIWCGERYLSEKEVFETVTKYSPEHFYELKICCNSQLDDLESFLRSWNDRTTKRSLSLIIGKMNYDSLELNEVHMKMIEKYKNLGIIKNFEIKDFEEVENNIYLFFSK